MLYSLMPLPLGCQGRMVWLFQATSLTDDCVKRVEQRLAAVFFCFSVSEFCCFKLLFVVLWQLGEDGCSTVAARDYEGTLMLSSVGCYCLVRVVFVLLIC